MGEPQRQATDRYNCARYFQFCKYNVILFARRLQVHSLQLSVQGMKLDKMVRLHRALNALLPKLALKLQKYCNIRDISRNRLIAPIRSPQCKRCADPTFHIVL